MQLDVDIWVGRIDTWHIHTCWQHYFNEGVVGSGPSLLDQRYCYSCDYDYEYGEAFTLPDSIFLIFICNDPSSKQTGLRNSC